MFDPVVTEGTKVTLHFAVSLAEGDIIDSTFDGDPATLTVGDGNLLPGFEQLIVGLTAGDKAQFTVKPEQGFGHYHLNNIQKIAKDRFARGMVLEKGLVMSFSDAQNTEVSGVVIDFDHQYVTVDFNHPLAGKDILFKVEIIAVEPTTIH